MTFVETLFLVKHFFFWFTTQPRWTLVIDAVCQSQFWSFEHCFLSHGSQSRRHDTSGRHVARGQLIKRHAAIARHVTCLIFTCPGDQVWTRRNWNSFSIAKLILKILKKRSFYFITFLYRQSNMGFSSKHPISDTPIIKYGWVWKKNISAHCLSVKITINFRFLIRINYMKMILQYYFS